MDSEKIRFACERLIELLTQITVRGDDVPKWLELRQLATGISNEASKPHREETKEGGSDGSGSENQQPVPDHMHKE